MAHAISTHALTKQFKNRKVVDSVSMTVPTGTVYGLIGPKDAGKSTLIRMILGLLPPTSGQVDVLGTPMNRHNAKQLVNRIGAMVDGPPGYNHLTASENMHIVQDMLGLTKRQVDRALDMVRLTPHRDKLIRTYSLGMRQRLGIAMVLARNPELIILDEPTNGLDVAGIEEIRLLLSQLASRGTTVLVTGHKLDEVDNMAHVVGIIDDGKLLFEGTRDALETHTAPDLVIETPDRTGAVSQITGAIPIPGGIMVRKVSHVESAKVIQRLALAGIPIYEVRRVPRSLEEVFVNLTPDGAAQ
ncbi:ABC transporter ATP-binding protein [Stomatohabitans albus]|uniref:ABC transporter ATP-binding protein n=1 Tax=Stomatohabitans albus TaxID=3110766 RepID=UPI00300D4CC8